MMSRAARARAYFQKRDFVIPDDVLWLMPHVLPHRILLTSKARHSGTTAKQILTDIIRHIKVPV
jgi:MoxR-like ATPase